MDLNKLMAQARQMQNSLTKIQEELNAKIYEGNTGGTEGVTVKVTGASEVVEVMIGEDLLNKENKEELQDMILIATNNALKAMEKEREEKLGDATSGLSGLGF